MSSWISQTCKASCCQRNQHYNGSRELAPSGFNIQGSYRFWYNHDLIDSRLVSTTDLTTDAWIPSCNPIRDIDRAVYDSRIANSILPTQTHSCIWPQSQHRPSSNEINPSCDSWNTNHDARQRGAGEVTRNLLKSALFLALSQPCFRSKSN